MRLFFFWRHLTRDSRTRYWPVYHNDVVGSDHNVDFFFSWLPNPHTCYNGICSTWHKQSPFWWESELASQQCLGDYFVHEPMLDYAAQCRENYRPPIFSLTHLMGNKEASQNGVTRMDPTLKAHLQSAVKTLTFLLLVGDHGLPYDDYTKTLHGLYEHRNPMSILFAPQAQLNVQQAWALYKHQDHLITMMDWHETLKELPFLRCGTYQQHHEKMSKNRQPSTYGLSLFVDWPHAERTCAEAGVGAEWCKENLFDDQAVSRTRLAC